MAATKVRPDGAVAAAEKVLESARAEVAAAEGEMAVQDALEGRLRRLLAEEPLGVNTIRPQIQAAREAYNVAYRAAVAARGREGDARRALRDALAAAARLSLPVARVALQEAEAAEAALVAEGDGLGVAQRAVAARGDVDQIAGILARREQIPHRLVAAQMAVLAAREQVLLGEADELDASVPALREATEPTGQALQAAQAAHDAAVAEVRYAASNADEARRRAREANLARRRLIDELGRDRGPVVRSLRHAGKN